MRRSEEETLDVLVKAWRSLRLSVRCPSRVATWDAIIVTAASPQQAGLYQLQLQRAQDRGRISPHSIILAVPDPHGRRIGSGGATLCAIKTLAKNFQATGFSDKRILLVHAGGDSKRVPWANAMGKAFLPLPFLAQNHPDEPVPLLFDHILAISSRFVAQLPTEGGIFIMTGDVLPCFDASRICLPESGALVVTTPAALEIASNHGVIISKGDGTEKVSLVDSILQKPSIEDMRKKSGSSTALLDTGIFSVTGEAWQDLIELAIAENDPVEDLLRNGEEMSLYEEMAGAWVPSRHKWLEARPLGRSLIKHLGRHQLYHHCANELRFLHFGTSIEILQHLRSNLSSRTHFSHVSSSNVACSAVILASDILEGVTVGDQSLIYNCSLRNSLFTIGANCVVLGVHETNSTTTLQLPDNHCLWEVPVKYGDRRVVLCCHISDNPKISAEKGGTFSGKPWDEVLLTLQLDKENLWGHSTVSYDLWNAKLFPVLPVGCGVSFALWLMGESFNKTMLTEWRNAERLSFAELQDYTDFRKMYSEISKHQAKLAEHLARTSLENGSMDRNLSMLTREILYGDEDGVVMCKELLSLYTAPHVLLPLTPPSRTHQARLDLCRACGDEESASFYEKSTWQAVANETAASVSGFGEGDLFRLHPSKSSRVKLPVRIDIVGGWSDTPPWSIERKGCVLNMAILLDGDAPVGAEALLKKIPGIFLSDDHNNTCIIEDATTITAPFDDSDPFRLVKAALVVTGFTKAGMMRFPWGLQVNTWAHVPLGSGLGTSSILAAAVIRTLLEVSDGNGSDDNVARMVLVVEQVMGSGGGWQDQIGGIFPGLKCTTSIPGHPLKFKVEPITLALNSRRELEERMLLVFTGQVRLAQTVLQKVVTRYLQRDSYLIYSIERLVELAKLGQQAFERSEVENVGSIMCEAWDIHQELDPNCSNCLVDSMFKAVAHLTNGYKLVGAGGGGFAILIAKHKNAAVMIKDTLSTNFHNSVVVYNWSLACLA